MINNGKNYIKVIDDLNFTEGSYSFTLNITALGGAIHYFDMTLKVYYDCNYDDITLISYLPMDNERVDDMEVRSGKLITKIYGVVGSFYFYDLTFSGLFTNNASYFC